MLHRPWFKAMMKFAFGQDMPFRSYDENMCQNNYYSIWTSFTNEKQLYLMQFGRQLNHQYNMTHIKACKEVICVYQIIGVSETRCWLRGKRALFLFSVNYSSIIYYRIYTKIIHSNLFVYLCRPYFSRMFLKSLPGIRGSELYALNKSKLLQSVIVMHKQSFIKALSPKFFLW